MRSVLLRWIMVLSIIAVGALRLHLALTRYFDPDEFAYLHWTWLITHGYQPYRDFFFYILPGFPWFLSPILLLTGDSTNFLIGSRVFVLLVYGLCAYFVYRLTKHHTGCESTPTSGVWAPLLSVLIFLTFPVTIDKTIDVRPDMVMLLFYFACFIVKNSLVSGILFGLSFLVFPKIIFALPALMYLRHPLAELQGDALRKFLAGVAFVGLGFLAYLWMNSLIPQAITSITKDSFAVTSGKVSFSPLLLFSPYPLIYLTKGGVSLPWAINTAIWVADLAGLAITMKTNRRMGIFWLLFIGGNILFVTLFPVPYVQYFLPLSIAGSVLAGHAITHAYLFINRFLMNHESGIMNYGRKKLCLFMLHTSYFILLVILGASFFLQYRDRTQSGAENAEQLQVIRDVLAVTKPSETMYDMVGSYVFRPDGYFICCHPYAEFADKLASQPVSLRDSLVARQTKFLVMDRVGFVFWQTPEPDKSFLLTNYLPMRQNKLYSLGLSFRCSRGACVQYNLNNQPVSNRSTNTFTILIPESYMMTIEPNGEWVTIDGNDIRTSQTLPLSAGPHRFAAAPTVTSFGIQLSR